MSIHHQESRQNAIQNQKLYFKDNSIIYIVYIIHHFVSSIILGLGLVTLKKRVKAEQLNTRGTSFFHLPLRHVSSLISVSIHFSPLITTLKNNKRVSLIFNVN